MSVLPVQFAGQPQAGEGPVLGHLAPGHAENQGGLVQGQPSEEAQPHDVVVARVQLGEPLEGSPEAGHDPHLGFTDGVDGRRAEKRRDDDGGEDSETGAVYTLTLNSDGSVASIGNGASPWHGTHASTCHRATTSRASTRAMFHASSSPRWWVPAMSIPDNAQALAIPTRRWWLLAVGLLFLVTALAIRLESPGPVFFSQQRVGRRGQVFKFWKFRSMYIDAEERKINRLRVELVAEKARE